MCICIDTLYASCQVSIVIDIMMSLGTDRCWHQITDIYWVLTMSMHWFDNSFDAKRYTRFLGLVIPYTIKQTMIVKDKKKAKVYVYTQVYFKKALIVQKGHRVMFVGNVIELKSEALGITHAITIPVTTHAIFFLPMTKGT